MNGQPVVADVYPHQIAFNCLPHIDVFLENGYTKEEMKMVNETVKIMGDETIKVSATCVRVPVFYGHSESVNIETEEKLSVEECRTILAAAPGVTVVDYPEKLAYPMAIDAAGEDDTFVGRIREDETCENALNMWIVSDNIRKGAALNTVQIAETLIERDLVRVP
jgi:aspartate-semialdehyde dehydrogenase